MELGPAVCHLFAESARAVARALVFCSDMAGPGVRGAGDERAGLAVAAAGPGAILSEQLEKSPRGRAEANPPAVNDSQGPRERAGREWRRNQRSRFHFPTQCRLGKQRNASANC